MDTNETTIYTAVLITSIVIGSIIIYFSIAIFRNHRKHFKMLSRQFLAEMELLEKERTRIARDLHDELGPILAVTQIHLNATEGACEKDKEHLEKAGKNIITLTERFEGIAKNLTPKILVSKGLRAAIEDFISQYEDATPIHIVMKYKLRTELTMFQAIHLYRIIQELVHNTIKHSGASKIEIQFAERKNKIYLLYNDDGKGFDKINKEEGLGKESLANRVQMMEGKMEYDSKPGKGIEYFFEIPIISIYA